MDGRHEMLDKAIDRGYQLIMTNGANSWCSMYNERYKLNLQLWYETGEFEISHMVGGILITTTKCGSFMNDKHFAGREKQIRKIVFDLL